MIGLINAYMFDPDPKGYQAQYEPMFMGFAKESGLDIRSYRVALGEKPKSFDECSGWIISGSSKGAYDNDPWIEELISFIQECHKHKKKLAGICFGHQLIAQSLGGKTEKSDKGWGVGIREFQVKKEMPWMKPPLLNCSLLFSHQDQVTELPPGAEHLASDPFCEYQMYSMGKHVFCLQGHPEFTPEFARSRYESRREKLGNQTYKTAMASLGAPTHRHELGQWLANFFKG